MVKKILTLFAVTVAFSAGAAVTTVLLGMPATVIPIYLEVTLLAGLIVDGLRFIASILWHGDHQLEHDIEDLFKNSLA